MPTDPNLLTLHRLATQAAAQADIMACDDVFAMMVVAFVAAMPLVSLLAKPRADQIAAH